MKSFLLFLLITIVAVHSSFGEDWDSVKENGKGTLTVFYYNSDNFISDESGKLSGIEYDILIEFKQFLLSEGIDLTLNFKKSKSFSALYGRIKNGGNSEIGACSFSMTSERMKEISFSPKYMPDIEVLINSSNIGVAKTEAEFITIFSELTALNVPNTTFEDDLSRLKRVLPAIKLEDVETAREIRDRISKEKDLFGYIELPTYLKLFKNGLRFKRQTLFRVERNGYGLILPKESKWLLPINNFFNSDEFKIKVNKIIKDHLGDGVNELLWEIDNAEDGVNQQEIKLLTMEREAQEMEIKQQGLRVQILIGSVALFLIVLFFLFYGFRMKKAVNKSLVERNNLIEQQKEELERLSIVAEKMNEAVLITDATGKIEYYNYSLVRNAGYTIEEFESNYKDKMYLQKITSREDIQSIIDGFRTNPKPFFYDSYHDQKDGGVMWTTASLSPVYDEKETLSKIIVVYTDISERKLFSNQLAEKNKEITDSINYAKMIQDAMLPSENILKSAVEDYFLLFQPKDIVSGDFYWFEQVGDYYIIVLADCTGHGVPGAFMSMMGSNFLSSIITDNSITSTGEALLTLDLKVKKALENEGRSSRDGMDIVMMAYNIKTKKMDFSGGNNSIFVLRNKELIKYKGDRFSIGADAIENKKFKVHEIQLEKGDLVYTFTDGYKDQFGGPKGKKFMQKKLLNMLSDNSVLALSEQKIQLENSLKDWMKGNDEDYEQIDDISVMGFRV